jgi:hypothetical protein
MSCLGLQYNPIPPREWNRFQPRNIDGETSYKEKMYRKGNVLQYFNNSARFTKNQKYARICQQKYISWASQTMNSTIPNIKLLKRVNEDYIPLPNQNIMDDNMVTSIQNAYCIKTPINNNNSLPVNNGGNNQPPPPPPPPPPVNNSPSMPPIIQDPGQVLYVIPSGGQLLCNQIVNPCTNTLLQEFKNGDCYSTTYSDVPGTPQLLCWSGRDPVYIPRVKRTYGISNNKWPINAKFIRSVNN